jgi:sodium/pantothenate symporter
MIGMHWFGTLSFPLLPEEGLETTDQVIPYVVLNNMPGWAAGLFLAAPLAAVMSTVDSLLILASATIIKDIYLNYIRREKPETAGKEGDKKVKVWSFVLTAAIGIIVYVFALNPPDIIVWINLFALGGLECTYFWPLIGGLYYKKGNANACIVSVVTALATFVFFNQFKALSPFGMHEVVWGLVVGGIAYFLVSSLSKEEPDEEMLRKCF